MKKLIGSKTEKNLLEALAGESIARNKYDWFASQAKKDGFEYISSIFSETASNEKEHAKIWFKILEGDKIKDTYSNLLAAAGGEKYEYSEMYKKMADEARTEGFDEIAKLFEGVSDIEKSHERRYLALADDIKNNKVFNHDTEIVWICRNCGHRHIGKTPPITCPVCNHPQAYFEKEKTVNK